MRQYNVTGMSCAACSARVEKAVGKVPGVTACSVSLLTNSMGVEGDVPPEQIIAAVEQAGYGASEKGAGEKKQSGADASALEDKETPVLKRRLIASVGFFTGIDVFFHGTYDVGMGRCRRGLRITISRWVWYNCFWQVLSW